jgi:hypothetical protein
MPMTCWTGTSPPTSPVPAWSKTAPTCALVKGGCIWRLPKGLELMGHSCLGGEWPLVLSAQISVTVTLT